MTQGPRLDPDLMQQLDRLAVTMRDKLRVGGRDVPSTLRKARPRLSGGQRREIDYMLEAFRLAEHPKLARQVDIGRISRAAQDITEALKPLNPKKAAELRWLGAFTALLVNLAILVALVVAFLVWRGLI